MSAPGRSIINNASRLKLLANTSTARAISSQSSSTAAAGRYLSYTRKNTSFCINTSVSAQQQKQPTLLARHGQIFARSLSDSTSGKSEQKEAKEASIEEDNAESKTEENAAEEEAEEKVEESKEAQLEKQVKDLKDQLLRSLAEQENTRRIAKRDVDTARNFAVTSFAKSLLDSSDNLSRALDAVPPEFRHDTENHPVLATLYEGIQMTDEGLTKAFAKNGLKKFGEVGEPFDPNKHEALFEYPDEKAEAGTIGQVMKTGFALNERVIRPAEVGVVKKP
eukprot:CAMPEP_0185724772 /NCGR_PEP_ID=MMETSP1171-20130828/1158_1 /TAXON_ID=374046 /ORGANISM="Helicotheca tamensis, Strain CCMP826" /LENGTH=278 /DNA_ID=CAMNT_0028392703 /DNA_START=34 /DNA_END=870 /DNA_ORIENTATION=-